MFAVYAVSFLLIGLSGLLIDSHRRSWWKSQHDQQLGERDLRFARSQYRRRMQASVIIGLLGGAIGLEPLVPRLPQWVAVYLAVLIGGCACIMTLALLDVVATQQNYHRQRSEQLTAEAKMARELRSESQSGDNNG